MAGGVKSITQRATLFLIIRLLPPQAFPPWIHWQMAQSNAHSLTPFILWMG